MQVGSRFFNILVEKCYEKNGVKSIRTENDRKLFRDSQHSVYVTI